MTIVVCAIKGNDCAFAADTKTTVANGDEQKSITTRKILNFSESSIRVAIGHAGTSRMMGKFMADYLEFHIHSFTSFRVRTHKMGL